MTALQELLVDLRKRGVSLEPVGDQQLAIDPIEKLRPDELEIVREYKPAILRLLAPERALRTKCPGSNCPEIITVIDGVGYCRTHNMAITFTVGVQ